MWIAKKPFYNRGKYYNRGDEVPAEEWGNRKAFVKIGRIYFQPDEVVVAPPADPKSLKREDLNAYALEHGITDPTAFKTKEDLLAALEAPVKESSDATTTPTNNEPTDQSSTPPSTEPVVTTDAKSPSPPVDDLFAN